MNTLNSIDELDMYKNTGLIEIAKHNALFHNYWDINRAELLSKFKNILDNNITIVIPDLDLKYIKGKYKEGVDCFEIKYKKDQPNYHENRKQHLIKLTKDRYKNDPEFREKMKSNSKKYYEKLKNLIEENKKMI